MLKYKRLFYLPCFAVIFLSFSFLFIKSIQTYNYCDSDCGCCDYSKEIQCLYFFKGEFMYQLNHKNRKQIEKNTEHRLYDCGLVGCSLGKKYRYCDLGLEGIRKLSDYLYHFFH